MAARRRQSSERVASIRGGGDGHNVNGYNDSNNYKNDSGNKNIRGEEINIPGYPRPSKGKEELPLEGRSKGEGYRCQVWMRGVP